MRGGRMLTTDNYECTWDLFRTIPSLSDPSKTVFDEILAFNRRMKAHSKARLVDRNRAIVDVSSMGFSMKDRIELLKRPIFPFEQGVECPQYEFVSCHSVRCRQRATLPH